MNPRVRIPTLTLLVCAALLCACASPPPAAPTVAAATPVDPAADAKRPPPPPGQRRYQWTKATEAEVAAQLDKKFQLAAKSYVQLKRDDQLMFCKRYREMGSSIRTLHCITEAELRKQVEDSADMRDQMRQTMGRCTLGQKVACSGQ
jgi:hypothetical protein